MTKSKRPQNPYTRRGLVQARVDTEEMQVIVTKAAMFSKGVLSDYVREACLNYKPISKAKVGK